MRDHDTALMVMSFDGAEDLWDPFFKLFFKFWPDCPFPIYLQTNHKTYDDPRVTSMKLGDDRSFSDLLKRAMEALEQEYVIIFLDDFLLTEPPDEQAIVAMLQLMRERSAGYFRLRGSPPPDNRLGEVGGFGYGSIDKGSLFRAGLQLAMWRRDVVLALIDGDESPREYEMRSGERSCKLPHEFLSVTRDREPPPSPVPYFCTGVIRGYWVPGAVKLCRQHGIEVDLKKRPMQPWHHRLAHGNPIAGALRKMIWKRSERKRGVSVPGSDGQADSAKP
jgi:hypothetical protein